MQRQLEALRERNAALLAEAQEARAVPDRLRCPITQEIMEDPVFAMDGHSYERFAIEQWFRQGRQTSPLTNQGIAPMLVPNHALRGEIAKFIAKGGRR